MTDEVLSHYRLYLAYSLGRLLFYAFLVCLFMAFIGVVAYVVGLVLSVAAYRPLVAAAVALASIVLLTARRFVHTLLHSPGVIAPSSRAP